jgi:hypothetical protein
MFEFLTRHRIAQDKPVEKTDQLLNNTKEAESKDSMDQIVENFLRANIYKGRSLLHYSQKLLSALAKEKEISQGVFFIAKMRDGKPVLRFLSGFAYTKPDNNDEVFEWGEGFPGQVAKDGELINISDIPEGYMSIESGLGNSSPVSLILFPVKHSGNILAVIELASFHKFTDDDERFFRIVAPAIAEQLMKYMTKS